MKYFALFLMLLLLASAVFLERSGMGWPLERPLVQFLARATKRPLPVVRAVSMTPNNQSVLAPQDVALTLRAITGFHPSQIIITEPVGDFSNGPFSLIREAQENGELQSIPIIFTTLPESGQQVKLQPSTVIPLDDLLFRREEMERGAIRADVDPFFRGAIILLGGPHVGNKVAALQAKEERRSVIKLSAALYGGLMLILSFIILLIVPLPWIDFLLFLLGLVFLYGGFGFLVFRCWGILLPLLLPLAMMLIAFVKKLLS